MLGPPRSLTDACLATVDGLGQSEPEAGGVDGRGVADLGPDCDHVGQREPPRSRTSKGMPPRRAAARVGIDAGDRAIGAGLRRPAVGISVRC